MPKIILPEQHQKYYKARREGHSILESSRLAGFSEDYGGRRAEPIYRQKEWSDHELKKLDPPKRNSQLKQEAKRSLEDFEYFRLRYMGHVSDPWQVEAATKIVELLATPQEEYVVINAPPGGGKTTLWHDIAAWCICRDRRVRILFGSGTTANAERSTNRLRQTLASVEKAKASPKDIALGLGVDAEAVLSFDFGAFRPPERDLWQRSQFIVDQLDGRVTEKEPTCSSFGADSDFIGGRYDLALWDDLVNAKNIRSAEAMEKLHDIWDNIAENRLDPGGLMCLCGQRLQSDDLYRYCLDKKVAEGEDENGNPIGEVLMYHHIVFKAHYEDRCKNQHRQDSPPYPEGCLLSPRRITMGKLKQKMSSSEESYLCVYQQEDVDVAAALVHPDWAYGRGDFPGCLDRDRDRLEYYPNMSGDLFSIATVDPSPSRYWGIEWWLFHPDSDQRFLIDLERKTMGADEALEWNQNSGCFTGLFEEWQQTSIDIGIPITHWVVETNACAKFLLQYDHVHRWMRKRGVDMIRHETHRNKSDPDYGVKFIIPPQWRYGRVRLPYKPDSLGKRMTLRLIEEVTKWPNFTQDDLVMAHWFAEYQFPRLYTKTHAPHVQSRPSWASRVPDLARR